MEEPGSRYLPPAKPTPPSRRQPLRAIGLILVGVLLALGAAQLQRIARGSYSQRDRVARLLNRFRPGGLRLEYAVEAPTGGGAPDRATLEAVATVVRARLSNSPLPSSVDLTPDGHIAVELRGGGAEDIAAVRRTLGRSGRLTFQFVDSNSAFMRALAQHAKDEGDPWTSIQIEHDQWPARSGSLFEDTFLTTPDRARLRRALAALPADYVIPPDRELLFERMRRSGNDPAFTGEPVHRTHLVERRAVIDNDRIIEAEALQDPATMRAEIAIRLDEAGARVFDQETAANVGRKLAIVLEGEVMSAPVIESRISGGRARVTLPGEDKDKVLQDAFDLVAVLRASALPAPLTLVRESVFH